MHRTLVFSAILVFGFSLSHSPLRAQGVITETIPAEQETDWSKPSFWETTNGNAAELSWEFVDGEIRLVRPRGGSGSLLSGPLPPNFELSWKWKIDSKTNTGLKYRVRKFSGRYLGLEYQIIDERPGAGGKGSTASIYDLVAPLADKPLKPAGEWNSARVVAVGNKIEHYLNDTLVASTRTSGAAWDAKIAVSKFWGAERFGKPNDQDRVMLTDHGGKAAYKDFRFVAHDAPDDDSKQESTGPFLGNALRNSWADQTSIVLWTRTTARPQFVSGGPDFVAISKVQQQQYAKTSDEEKLLSIQLPDGLGLDQMLGACPGMAGQVRLTYFPVLRRNAAKTTPWVTTAVDSDYTAQWKLTDLNPDKEYAAVIEAKPLGGDEPSAVVRGAFRTAPQANRAKDFRFCMVTCHDFIRRDDGLRGHKIYPSMSAIEPDFVVHAGDIEYYDKERPWAWTIDLMRFKWGRIFSLPNNRDFYQRTTSYFLKDDHDTLKNDCSPGQSYGSVTFEQGVRLFNEEQFPSHSPRYKTVRWGRDAQVWFLEGRDYRSPNDMPDGPKKTILGEQQKQWLFSTLDQSDAAFKLIFSPTPIVGPDRENKKDNHANTVFAHEGNELRRELSKRDGVIVFCGDRHWQYASVDDESGLWEFGCGPGSEKHQLGWKQGDERPVHRFLRVAGGFLSGQVAAEDDDASPKLTLRHHTVTGEVVSEFEFPVASAATPETENRDSETLSP